MIYSNERKLCLCGWLKENDVLSYENSLRLQKYLFLYESFSKVAGVKTDFAKLKGYKRGPVFSSVWGDYTKDRVAFDRKASETYETNSHLIDESRARRSSFIVSSLSESELSELTHNFHIWGAKKTRIMDGEQQVELSEEDFSTEDVALTKNVGRYLFG